MTLSEEIEEIKIFISDSKSRIESLKKKLSSEISDLIGLEEKLSKLLATQSKIESQKIQPADETRKNMLDEFKKKLPDLLKTLPESLK